MKQENIRNFSIIAHIDHGKSTLADRILEVTGAISEREKQDQLLDNMDIERERGITIKLNTVQLKYHYKDEDFLLHLIDTPGHVDFSYEVSRSLAACEGAVLVVDAAQGIEAQTLANLYLALDNNLTIIPVINKIDLPNADPEKVKKELMDTLGFREDEFILTSAKNGIGIVELVEAIIDRIPAPNGKKTEPLQALIFDSYYDSYRGIVALARIVNGTIRLGDKIKMMATGATYDVVELGVHNPKEYKKKELTNYRRYDIGFVFQFYNLVGNLTALENVSLASQICKHPKDSMETLKSVGLIDRINHFPAQLSGGEQQRVSIARALAKNPKLLLCDEPTGALDSKTGKKVLSVLQETCHKSAMTTIIITHNAIISEMADKVIKIKNGKVEDIVINEKPKLVEEIDW